MNEALELLRMQKELAESEIAKILSRFTHATGIEASDIQLAGVTQIASRDGARDVEYQVAIKIEI